MRAGEEANVCQFGGKTFLLIPHAALDQGGEVVELILAVEPEFLFIRIDLIVFKLLLPVLVRVLIRVIIRVIVRVLIRVLIRILICILVRVPVCVLVCVLVRVLLRVLVLFFLLILVPVPLVLFIIFLRLCCTFVKTLEGKENLVPFFPH